MGEFFINYWFLLLIVLGFAGYIIYLIVNRRWVKLREIAYKLIRQAEAVIVGTKKGQERFELVFDQLYNTIPGWLRLFIPKNMLEQKLQEWFDIIKDSLDDGVINNSVKNDKEG